MGIQCGLISSFVKTDESSADQITWNFPSHLGSIQAYDGWIGVGPSGQPLEMHKQFNQT